MLSLVYGVFLFITLFTYAMAAVFCLWRLSVVRRAPLDVDGEQKPHSRSSSSGMDSHDDECGASSGSNSCGSMLVDAPLAS
ncbi:hypothetical protein DQ04_02471060 [Trypanosoma grayi]|uniref:hypothetical protein n=1 Tax=Trypanosoma grayi TaxID=71804 RepID=UPI0004F4680C|nr:hypothetical protein DQ04_02471060 [Trypanosoma grayi]KEG11579.1 hypothetical protein DQ04_02471060 [Trypanosoma grayi]